jgi:Rrf2 family protein
MKVSTRVRYGLRAALELAEYYGNGPLQTRVIAKNQDISVKYLEQLMATLKSAGLIRSVRGSKGGYILAKTPDQVKLSEIYYAFEGTVATVECVQNEDYCGKSADCAARGLWIEVERAIVNVLESKTLEELLEAKRARKNSDYQI